MKYAGPNTDDVQLVTSTAPDNPGNFPYENAVGNLPFSSLPAIPA
jgi:hypothetical protein